MNNDKQQSPIIQHRLPEFIQTDNPTMVAFVQSYFEWLDNQGQQGYIRTPNALDGINDIDETLDIFVENFKKEYLLNFPERFAVNKEGNTVNVRNLMKNIKEFYRNKGTEKTYEFLFRILYDAAVEFYYPAKDILRLSDGKWIQKRSIRCSNSLGNVIFDARGKQIAQRSLDGSIVASAKVVDVVVYQLGSREIAELYLTNINGQFQSNTNASTNYGGIAFEDNFGVQRLEPKIYSVLSDISITNSGTNYRKGERIFFTPNISSLRQNLLKYSQQFDVPSYWVLGGQPGSGDTPTTTPVGKARSILATNRTTAPDGSYTAYRFVPSDFGSGSAGNNLFTITASARNIEYENGKYYTISCYLKADDYASAYLRLTNSDRSSFTQILVNPNTSEITSSNLAYSTNRTGWGQHDKKVVSAGNGWYRVSFTAQRTGTTIKDGGVDVFLGRGAYNSSLIQTATTNYGIFVWGLQVNEADDPAEAETHPTMYAKTTNVSPIEYPATNDSGQGAIATITEVDSLGGIVGTRIDNFGAGYEISPFYTIDSKFGSGATIATNSGTLCKYPGYYSNNDGRLSTNKVMQDNHYYQSFSYVLLTEIVIDRYKEIFRSLLHPAGMGMFGKVRINRCSAQNPLTDVVVKKIDTEVIGTYVPYTLGTHVDIGTLLFNGRPTPYFPSLHAAAITGAAGNPSDLLFYTTGQNFLTWSKDASKWGAVTNAWETTANYDTAPDGTQTATLIRKKSAFISTLDRRIRWNSSSKSATYSIFLKQPATNAKRYASLIFRNNNRSTNLISALWDFDAMQFSTGASTVVSPYGTASYEALPNGWYRFKLTVTSGIQTNDQLVLYYGDTGYTSTDAQWLEDDSILVWGIQLEEGEVANEIVETTTVPRQQRPYAVAFNPKNISGLKVWLDGKSLTAAGATIDSWRDSSGNGLTAISYSKTRLPTISVMGGVHLTGSNLTFGSVLTTPNFNIGERTMFAVFTPFPVPEDDLVTSQKNAMVVGIVRGQSNNGSTGSATGNHYQDHTLCIDYGRQFVDSYIDTSPHLYAYYGVGNYAGPTAMALTDFGLTATIFGSQTEVSTGRFAVMRNNDARIAIPLSELSSVTANNANTMIVCSVIGDGTPSLTAAFYSSNGDTNTITDKKSNNDFTIDAQYYRYQKIADYRIPLSEIAVNSYKFAFDLVGSNKPPYYWKAVLTKNEVDLPNGASLTEIPEQFVVAEWSWASFTDSPWSATTAKTYETILKNLRANDYVSLWVSPCEQSGAKPKNNTLNTANPYQITLSNFVISKVYSSGENLLTVDGLRKESAAAYLKGLTANQRLSIGLGQNYFNGVLHEVLVYDRELSERERQIIEAYLYRRWKNRIIDTPGHPWNLPIASLDANSGIYPALSSDGGLTAFSTITNSLGYPFYEISSHPNILLSKTDESYAARIHRSQLEDFLGGGTGADGYWPEWNNESLENRLYWASDFAARGITASKIATFSYYTDSEFRKITAEAFFDRKLGRQFDCKNEIVNEPSAPKCSIVYTPSFVDDIVFSNGTIVFNYQIVNPQNMDYWIANLMEIEVSDGRKFYRYGPENPRWAINNQYGEYGQFAISGFVSEGSNEKQYSVSFRLLDYYRKPIAGSETTLSFRHKYGLPTQVTTIYSFEQDSIQTTNQESSFSEFNSSVPAFVYSAPQTEETTVNPNIIPSDISEQKRWWEEKMSDIPGIWRIALEDPLPPHFDGNCDLLGVRAFWKPTARPFEYPSSYPWNLFDPLESAFGSSSWSVRGGKYYQFPSRTPPVSARPKYVNENTGEEIFWFENHWWLRTTTNGKVYWKFRVPSENLTQENNPSIFSPWFDFIPCYGIPLCWKLDENGKYLPHYGDLINPFEKTSWTNPQILPPGTNENSKYEPFPSVENSPCPSCPISGWRPTDLPQTSGDNPRYERSWDSLLGATVISPSGVMPVNVDYISIRNELPCNPNRPGFNIQQEIESL